ncbi:23S rRNA pseudouridine(955/2504/2580) synthase RluC [Neptuniibacter halophilus]|uniref:23S rRNA pseudouridine(955/2504/2580) synthase RluC n=1 Tax=Neptuniibacter halophilus TaxID=651666 RepID=UPI002573664D|nr:23S rRNA pseudouridine(955/2504/2580) synthase RluC [Neptuniibacter halophilus]
MSQENSSTGSKVSFIEITEDNLGQRIDNFLITALKGAPKSLVYRILRKGEVRVNKKRIKPEYRLQIGDLVRVPPVRLADKPAPAKASGQLVEQLEAAILYEDDDLIVVNKPSGLAVHGGSGISLGLIESFRQIRPQCKFMELVHRLDRDTSGCILLAKKRSALRLMHESLQKSRITKIYHALVIGSWPERKQRIDAPLRKNELKSGERVVKVAADGKASLTEYKVLERYGREATLVEARPITGRTHQIRVHCQFAGHPIAGDDKYTSDQDNALMRERGVNRLFLHAAELRFPLPSGGRKVIKAPLEIPLQRALNGLKSRNN